MTVAYLSRLRLSRPPRHFLGRWFLVAAVGLALTWITRVNAFDASSAGIADPSSAFARIAQSTEKATH